MASRIEDYGLIGDMKGSALVSCYADIDWLCVPRFDSDASMAALLGRDEHGRWAIRPTTRMRKHEQRYRGDTLVLETDIECDGGKFRVIDFMPPGTERSDVVRIVEGLAGEVFIEMILEARFGYGSCIPWIKRQDDVISIIAGPDALHLRSSVEVKERLASLGLVYDKKGGHGHVRCQLCSLRSSYAGCSRSASCIGRDRNLLARVVGPMHLQREMA